MTIFDRRQMLSRAMAGSILLCGLYDRNVWAGGRPTDMDAWARAVIEQNELLAARQIGVTQWQDTIERLNSAVPLADIVRYLDIDRLTARFRYETNLADVADPVLPAGLVPPGQKRNWFIRIFGMRRGGAIIPHVHNHMVSAHLAISGAFHARTYDRVSDADGAVMLKPSVDAALRPGQVISMSDQRDNGHWLLAQEDRSMTFDVGVVGLPASWTYGHQAGDYNMIFVDPDRPVGRDGLIEAPILSFEECAAKFAGYRA
jgi:hypothetical protein